MRTLTRARFGIVLFLSVFLLLLASRPASASPVGLTLTLDSTGPFTVTGGNSITLDFTLANNTGEELQLSQIELTLYNVILGDDDFIDLPVSYHFPTSPFTLSAGGLNNFSITFPTDAPTEPDFDFNPQPNLLSLGFTYCPASDPQCSSADEFSSGLDFFISVQDGNSATPEPSSLILLGTGLLGLGPLVRRRFSRA